MRVERQGTVAVDTIARPQDCLADRLALAVVTEGTVIFMGDGELIGGAVGIMTAFALGGAGGQNSAVINGRMHARKGGNMTINTLVRG